MYLPISIPATPNLIYPISYHLSQLFQLFLAQHLPLHLPDLQMKKTSEPLLASPTISSNGERHSFPANGCRDYPRGQCHRPHCNYLHLDRRLYPLTSFIPSEKTLPSNPVKMATEDTGEKRNNPKDNHFNANSAESASEDWQEESEEPEESNEDSDESEESDADSAVLPTEDDHSKKTNEKPIQTPAVCTLERLKPEIERVQEGEIWRKKVLGNFRLIIRPRLVQGIESGCGPADEQGGNISARFLCSGSPALRRQEHNYFSFDVLQLQRRRNLPRTWHGTAPLHTPGPGRTGKFRSVRSCSSGTADLEFTDLPPCPSTSLRTRPRRPSTSSASNEYTPRSPTW
eukprot:g15971.t1